MNKYFILLFFVPLILTMERPPHFYCDGILIESDRDLISGKVENDEVMCINNKYYALLQLKQSSVMQNPIQIYNHKREYLKGGSLYWKKIIWNSNLQEIFDASERIKYHPLPGNKTYKQIVLNQ